MNLEKRKKLNKVLIIIAIVLIVILIAVLSVFLYFNSKNNKEHYEDKITNKNYFVEISIDLDTKEIQRDKIETALQNEFLQNEEEITEEMQNLILSSENEIRNFFDDSSYDVEIRENKAYITNKYQTKKILVETKNLKSNFDAEEVVEEIGGLYTLRFDTMARTKAAFEYFETVDWIDNFELDEVSIVQDIPDESQTVYGESVEKEDLENKSYGVSAMGLDKYKNVIKENGNPSEITIATIGYGGCIDDKYFEGRISDKSYNFIKNSKEIYETVPQGSRVLEVLKEGTEANVKLMPLVVVNDEKYTTTSAMVKAIVYATKNSDVVCYEIINKPNKMIDLVLNNAFKENVPVCCVTNNMQEDVQVYPANHATTIATSSIDKDLKLATYSATGDYLDFAASSTDVEEIFNKSSSVSRWSGSQYANAHIVSAIALIQTYDKQFTILEIYNVLRNYCKDLGDEGKDIKFGYGCPDFSGIKISDIDKKAPEIAEVNYDNEKWENKKIVQIKANDNIRIWGWAVTSSNAEPKEWNKLEVISHELDVTTDIEKNGTYYIWVSDSAGKKSYMNIEVNKIDIVGPKIEYTIDDSKKENEKYISINVTASDDESGLHEMAYSWDKENWGRDNNILKVTENGRYKIYVRDAVENISEKEIVINNFNQEGIATIGEGTIIKSIVVSSSWTGDTNDAVRITFNNNLNIKGWKITESNIVPTEFNDVQEENLGDDEENQESLDNVNQSQGQNEINNVIGNIGENAVWGNSTGDANTIATDNLTNGNDGDEENNQIKRNVTITIPLKAGVKYYAWIKDKDGNVISQAFTVSRVEI